FTTGPDICGGSSGQELRLYGNPEKSRLKSCPGKDAVVQGELHFNACGLFMTVGRICSWQHQLLQEEDGHQRGSLAIWARNCSCLDSFTGHAVPTERGLLNFQKGQMFLWVPAS
ncbi:hypothetical protein LEMLEM_LOCUS17988, partial [Lemmus lemmus]